MQMCGLSCRQDPSVLYFCSQHCLKRVCTTSGGAPRSGADSGRGRARSHSPPSGHSATRQAAQAPSSLLYTDITTHTKGVLNRRRAGRMERASELLNSGEGEEAEGLAFRFRLNRV